MADLLLWAGDGLTAGAWDGELGDGSVSGTADSVHASATLSEWTTGSGAVALVEEYADPAHTDSVSGDSETLRLYQPTFATARIRFLYDTDHTTSSGRFYWRRGADQGGYSPYIGAFYSNGALAWRIQLLSNDNIRVSNQSSTTAGTDYAYGAGGAGDWLRFEWQQDGSDYDVQMWAESDNGHDDDGTPTKTWTGTTTATSADEMRLGSHSQAALIQYMYYDSIRVTDTATAVGPYTVAGSSPGALTMDQHDWEEDPDTILFGDDGTGPGVAPEGFVSLTSLNSTTQPTFVNVFGAADTGPTVVADTAIYYGPPLLKADNQSDHYDDYRGGVPESLTHRRYMEVYYPDDTVPVTPAPVVVFIPGGGFQSHNIILGTSAGAGGAASLKAAVLAEGWVFVVMDYRSARGGGGPNGVFHPDQIHDIKMGLETLSLTAGNHGIDVDELHVCGHSAGGYLALMSLLTAGVTSLPDVSFDSNGLDQTGLTIDPSLTDYFNSGLPYAGGQLPGATTVVPTSAAAFEGVVDFDIAIAQAGAGVVAAQDAGRAYIGAPGLGSGNFVDAWSLHCEIASKDGSNPSVVSPVMAIYAGEGHSSPVYYSFGPVASTGMVTGWNGSESDSGQGWALRLGCADYSIPHTEERYASSSHDDITNDSAGGYVAWLQSQINRQDADVLGKLDISSIVFSDDTLGPNVVGTEPTVLDVEEAAFTEIIFGDGGDGPVLAVGAGIQTTQYLTHTWENDPTIVFGDAGTGPSIAGVSPQGITMEAMVAGSATPFPDIVFQEPDVINGTPTGLTLEQHSGQAIVFSRPLPHGQVNTDDPWQQGTLTRLDTGGSDFARKVRRRMRPVYVGGLNVDS